MSAVYINAAVCISAQDTLEPDFLTHLHADNSQNILYAKQPSYKEHIAPAQLRRMSKVVKMSTISAQKALAEADVAMPDAIITGTGMGCTEDSEKFLRSVIQNGEDYLTPTSFIQSTHNTVAGQIAIGLGCHGYNFTYVNSGTSLEFALLDAKIQIENEGAENILAGASDETSQRTAEIYQLAGLIKKPYSVSPDFLKSTTPGAIWGEGAAFFVLSKEKKTSSYAVLKDIALRNHIETGELKDFTEGFLTINNLSLADVDAVLLGFSGNSEHQENFREMQKILPDAAQLYYKHLCGEYNTAAGFSFFLASHILKNQQIPELIKINKSAQKEINNILIYNNFFGQDHSLTLLQKA